jgi:hypothetical protein
MENISLIISIVSMVAAIITAIPVVIAYNKYVEKKSVFGQAAKDEFEDLELDDYKCKSYEFGGGAGKKFPNLVTERKWGKILKVTYYVEEGGKRMVKEWQK